MNEENIFNNLCIVLNLMGNFDRLRRDFKIINSTNPRLYQNKKNFNTKIVWNFINIFNKILKGFLKQI